MLMRILFTLLCCLLLASLGCAQNLITNGGFEEPADGPGTTIAGWTKWRGLPDKPNVSHRVTDNVASGKWSLFMRRQPGGATQVVEQKFTNYQPGQLYEIVFHALSREPYGAFRVSVIDRHPDLGETKTLVSQDFTNLEWTQYAVHFTAPGEAGHPLYVRFYPIGPKPDSGVYVDDVQILAVSRTVQEFKSTYTGVEADTFQALVKVEFDLHTALDVVKWLLEDLVEYQVANPAQVAPLRQRCDELDEELRDALVELKSFRDRRLMTGVVLSTLPDAEVAAKAKLLAVLTDALNAEIGKLRAELEPLIDTLAVRAKALEGDWQAPVEATVEYNPKMLNDRFHRIISYSTTRTPSDDYTRRALWELKPTILLANPHPDYEAPDHTDYLKHTLPRTMPYIAYASWAGRKDPAGGWFDLTETKQSIDATFGESRDKPGFCAIGIDEPSITQQHVCTPQGYAEFRTWLAARYQDQVAGFPLADALAWERPTTIQTDFDLVMGMELRRFMTQWMAQQFEIIEDYIKAKDPNLVFQLVIQQYLPSAPQRASYVTVPAVLDWISMDPYNSANVGEALQMDLLRSNSKGPNLLVVGTCYDRTPGRFAKDLAISFAHTGGVYPWCWVYMSEYRSPAYILVPKSRGRWKPGMYDAALDIMGKMAVIEPYLVHTDTAANVGLVYSERTGIHSTLATRTADYYVNNLGIYQALQQLQIPCEALFAESMTPEKLSRFASLILVDAELLTDDEAALLKDWCHEGGSLIALGGVGTRDQWGRRHDDYGALTELFGVTRGETKTGANTWKLDDGAEVKLGENWHYDAVEPVADSAQIIGHFDNGDITAVRCSYGAGTAYLLTAHNLGLSFDGSAYPKGLYKDYWPGFKENLRSLILHAAREAGARLPMRAQNAPDNVEVGLRKQGGRLIVHLLNYDDEGPVSGMVLLADGRADQRAFYPADSEEIATTKQGRDLQIPVRDFEHHCCIVIEPR